MREVVCPNCWNSFRQEDVLFISQHPDLLGDPILGPEQQLRFLPSRFTPDGRALDARSTPCPDLACPTCHLRIPQAAVDMPSMIFSIVGAQASGKSYFLTSMVWELRSCLRRFFSLNFTDADAVANQSLNRYEEHLFLNRDTEKPVSIPKTQLFGDMYNQVMFNGVNVQLPRPFIFSLSSLETHPVFVARKKHILSSIILYDNAGEHFEPGQDSFKDPVTLHLTESRGLIFLLDPTQHTRFRSQCTSTDPQLAPDAKTQRQDVLLTEMASRIRRHKGIKAREKSKAPLVVVVSKYDVWKNLLDFSSVDTPWNMPTGKQLAGLDIKAISSVSAQLRQLIERLYPEFVTAAESLFDNVTYIPNSALGHSPSVDAGSGELRIKPSDISPFWASVSLLYLLYMFKLIYPLDYLKDQKVPFAK